MVTRSLFVRTGLICAAIAFCGCTTINDQIGDIVFIPNPNSDRRTEIVDINLAYSSSAPCERPENADDLANGECDFIGLPLATDEKRVAEMSGVIAGDAAGLAKTIFKEVLASEANRYAAAFSADASSGQFYHYEYPTTAAARMPDYRDGPMGPGAYRTKTDVKFAGFRLTRRLSSHKQKNGKDAVAMSICAIVLPSQTDAFIGVIPVSYSYRYSKAKLIGFNMLSPLGVDLLNPWEAVTNSFSGKGYDLPPADRDIDVSVQVGFEHIYFTDKKVKLEPTNAEAFPLPAVAVTGEPVFGYFADYEKFRSMASTAQAEIGGPPFNFDLQCDESASPRAIADLRDRIMMNAPLDNLARMQLEASANPFPTAPRALPSSPNQRYGNANFKLTVAVTETDDYGARIADIKSALETEEKGSDSDKSSFLDKLLKPVNRN